MGLEIAEFMIALEDELDIRFDEASPFEAEIEVTVRMVVDCVERKIRDKEIDELMAATYPQKVFEQTATIMAQFAEVPTNDITPETLLTDLFPDARHWQKMWKKKLPQKTEMATTLAGLLAFKPRKKNLFHILYVLGAVIFFISILVLHPFGNQVLKLRLMCVISLIVGLPFLFILGQLFWKNPKEYRDFPPDDITVGQFAEAITAHRHRFLAPDGSPMTRSTIELRVIEILADIIAVKPNDIMLTDRLVQDLKMG